MADAVQLNGSKRSPFLREGTGTPTALYFYPHLCHGYTMAEAARDFGRVNADGTITEGALVDQLQALNLEGLLGSTAVMEIDADATSPYKGQLRWKIVLAAAD